MLLVSFLLAVLVIRHRTAVQDTLSTIGPAAYPVAVIVFAVVASAPFSVTDVLAIMNGVIFGPLWGSVVNAVGLVVAAVAGYAIARRTSKLLDLEANIEKLPGWVRRFRVGSPQFLLALRLIPGLGGTLATQIAAALKVPVFVQVWTMCAIAVPICTLLAIFGDRLSARVHDYYEAHKPHVPHMPHLHVNPHLNERLHELLHDTHTPLPERP